MQNYTETKLFNAKESVVEGWYWAIPSHKLKKGQVKPISLMGQELAVYRGQSGKVVAMDAFCPHMGAHLAEGKVEGDELRCFFHAWKFNDSGRCTEIPILPKPVDACVKTWPVEERYGLIWVYTGETPKSPVPFVPELEGEDIDTMYGGSFRKECHPHVMMINAIDAHHFASVHNLPVKLNMEPTPLNRQCLEFANTTTMPNSNFLTRLLGKFYGGALTYKLAYWYGSNGTVTLGPDFWHFHILFALRPTPDGKTEGQTILITKKLKGPLGAMWSKIALGASYVVGKYFAQGDTKVFKTIRFNMAKPVGPDAAIMRYIKHVEAQPQAVWGISQAKSPSVVTG